MKFHYQGGYLEIIIQNAYHFEQIPLSSRIKSWVNCALGEDRPGELTVRIVNEFESAVLNERYRKVAGATNILAFPYQSCDTDLLPESEIIGDLVVCAPVLEREATAQGKALIAHWAHILIHGSLHLIGYDHENKEEAKAMEAKERVLLEALGFDNPYKYRQ